MIKIADTRVLTVLEGRKKVRLGEHATERVAAGAHLPTPWLFEPAKRPDDRKMTRRIILRNNTTEDVRKILTRIAPSVRSRGICTVVCVYGHNAAPTLSGTARNTRI